MKIRNSWKIRKNGISEHYSRIFKRLNQIYLEQDVVDGHLHLETQRVARVLPVQDELVVDVKLRYSRDGLTVLSSHLVGLSLSKHLLLQLLNLRPEVGLGQRLEGKLEESEKQIVFTFFSNFCTK